MAAKAIYLHALTPVHSGTGQESASVVDQPAAREKATGWPIIPASSLKGVLRGMFGAPDAAALFGSTESSGTATFGDQRLLALPVRSYRGTFAWVTCPLVLRRWERDRAALGLKPLLADPSAKGESGGAAAAAEAQIAGGCVLREAGKLYLEDLDLAATESAAANTAAAALAGELFDTQDERRLFIERFAIVPDDIFDFLCETALEIIARIKLDETTKTTTSGGLWYEEAVPAEAVFAGVVLAREASDLQILTERLREHPILQIGGQANVGRGLCRVRVV